VEIPKPPARMIRLHIVQVNVVPEPSRKQRKTFPNVSRVRVHERP
jgi:hypothetical protein